MPKNIEALEQALDNFDLSVRQKALADLQELVRAGHVSMPAPMPVVNLHAHTFFSYNAYGYSPSRFAWLARRRGLEAAGIVDFDVLDGLDEFLQAGRLLDIKTCVGIESRVHIPEFADREINSPGEPGISYHMGVGFTTARVGPEPAKALLAMRRTAEQRNRALVDRVNAFTNPVKLDYDRDVIPLTPSGNATERHICLAYARKAHAFFPAPDKLSAFWSDKLGETPESFDIPEGPKLQNLIRAKTMKRGGPGYVAPDAGSFPRLADMNKFVLQSGAIPTMTWLNGMSDGEKAIDELVATAAASGTAALNVIPDRNFTPGEKDQKLQNLYDVVALAEQKGFPVFMGTEMNSPGQTFVDAFDSQELKPLGPIFVKGAHIAYAHSVLQREAGLGYLSPWAKRRFANVKEKNAFFEELGRTLDPSREDKLAKANDSLTPGKVLALVKDD
jgi:hypothetical protein